MIHDTRKLRAELEARFGIQLKQYEFKYSTNHYVYISPEDYVVCLRTITQPEEMSQLENGELAFMSDCMHDTDSVCGPLISLRGRFVECFSIDGITFAVSKMRKALGHPLVSTELTNEHAQAVGKLLGQIHEAGRSAAKSGRKYTIPTRKEYMDAPWQAFQRGEYHNQLTPDVSSSIHRIIKEVDSLPVHEFENWGPLHGDFTFFNYMVQGNDVNVFDFGDCHYGFYMYDIATILVSWFVRMDVRHADSMMHYFQELLAAFRTGYEKHMVLEQSEWDLLQLMMRDRLAIMILHVLHAEAVEGKPDKETDVVKRLRSLIIPMMADNVIESMAENAVRTQKIIARIRNVLETGTLNLPENLDVKMMLSSDESRPFINAIISQLNNKL